jgi:DNA helicase-2/ATP-dependent DNA helicase PcrA
VRQAEQAGLPGYCVFTDKTLMAIAEARPEDEGGLTRIAGVGSRKTRLYGTEVLALCAGQELDAGEQED